MHVTHVTITAIDPATWPVGQTSGIVFLGPFEDFVGVVFPQPSLNGTQQQMLGKNRR